MLIKIPTKVNSKKVKSMDMESKLKIMATSIKVIMFKIRNKVKVKKPKQMETIMSASGSTTGTMARAC